MTQLTIEDLTQIARDFLRAEYGIALDIPVTINGRLRRSAGRYMRTHKDDPLRIEIAKDTMCYATDKIAVDIIKHECVHYAFHLQGKPYRDGQKAFEDELTRLGISNNYDNNFATIVGKGYVFKCVSCDEEIHTTQKKAYEQGGVGYKSQCCSARLTAAYIYIGDGEKEVERL